MGILIYEHFLGNNFKKEISPAILNEAKIITTSIANDFLNCRTQPDVSILINKKNFNLLNNFHLIQRNNEYDIVQDICANINKNDYVLIVAPEENMELYTILKKLEKRYINLLNCKSNFVKISTNKSKINEKLKNSKNYLIETFDNYHKINKNYKIIAKIIDGYGSEDLFVFENRNELLQKKGFLTDKHIYQKFYEGSIVGINIVANDNKYKILSINQQKYEKKCSNSIALKQFHVGKFNILYELFDEFVKSILSNLEGFQGFFGIDAILTNDGRIYFLEINPRLTTSYSCLLKSLGFNPLDIYFNINSKFDIKNNKNFLINV